MTAGHGSQVVPVIVVSRILPIPQYGSVTAPGGALHSCTTTVTHAAVFDGRTGHILRELLDRPLA